MDKRILDLVTTRYMSQKIVLEMELEKLLNNPPQDLDPKKLSDEIMSAVQNLRVLASNNQMWESVALQFIQSNPEEGNNNN